MADPGMRCETCGRLNPQLATGMSASRSVGDRLLAYEGYAPGGRTFRYTGSPKCMVCRHGTRSQLRHQPATGEALKAWLVAVNAPKE